MRIIMAKTAGFCMGVRRAVDIVLDASNSTDIPICTYGPLIHNPQVLEMLKSKDIPSIDNIPEKGTGIVIIRAHGVPPQDKNSLKKAGFSIIDATCPRVIRVQTILRKHREKGYSSIIIGDSDHPEVRGLIGYAGNKGYTAATMDELKKLPEFEKAVVVAQTTQNTSFYNEVKAWIGKQYPHYKIFDTICDSTEKRQAEVREIAAQSDAVVVVGGKQSGNTQRLAQIAKKTGKPSFHIEDISELDLNVISHSKSVAVTAGASTPNWIINRTCKAIEESLESKLYGHTVLQIINFLLKTNILLSIGAGCLTYACIKLEGLKHFHNFNYAAIAMLYVLSMQIINNLFTVKSDQYNNPDRAEFYRKNKLPLSVLSTISGFTGLFLALEDNYYSFFILAVMSILGLSYNKKFFSVFRRSSRIQRIKDIPGSKTILIALAWGIVTSLIPAIPESNKTAVIPVFFFSSGLVFARTAFFNILEIQGDRITGKETLPILLGEKNSMLLIKAVLISVSAVLVLSSLCKIIQKTGFSLTFLPLLLLSFIIYTEKKSVLPGIRLEFIVEFHFILAGIIAAIF